jgi:protein-S-isoprenylcysteine O-methyltransferase Ste14
MRTKQNKTYPNLRIQPPVLTLIHVAVAFLLTWLIPLPLMVPPILRTAGFLLALIGFLLGVAALMAFRSTRTAPDSPRQVSSLITSGVYRFTRNPVNLGFVLILVGFLLNAGSYWGILLAPVLVILFNRLVVEREEEYLAQKFGDEYSHYKSKVRRWI